MERKELKEKFLEKLNEIIEPSLDIIERGNTDEITGALHRLNSDSKNNSNLSSALEVLVITSLIRISDGEK